VRAGRRALTGGPGDVTDRGGERTDRAVPAPGDTGAGRACAKRYPRSGSCDQDRTEGIRLGGSEQLRAAPLLSAAVKSPELGQARNRVAPGSLGLGREGEDDMANLVAGKRPRIRR
jgi:hypothetical protein